MISQKGKRKLIYKDRLYYWFVKLDEDYHKPYLLIISDDRKLQLFYPLNQTNDKFSYPVIRVSQAEKLKAGWYCFSPPIADEFVSAHNVCAILNWYEAQDKDQESIGKKTYDHPFGNIDFGNGVVTHIETDFSQENLREDMLQVIYPGDYLLDVGWYGTSRGYIISVIRNQDWENPVASARKGFYELHEAVICAIEMIEKLSKDKK